MKTLHLGNVNFEWELETRSTLSLQKTFEAHPVFLQLQYLPLLYVDESDGVLVSHMPPDSYLKRLKNPPSIHLMNDPIPAYDALETWGWSENAKKWADQKGIDYCPPHFPKVRTLTSKLFSFTHSPALPGAHLFHTIEEAESWIKEKPYPKVLKTCFGLAGQGHFLLASEEDFFRLKSIICKIFEWGDPLIGEPWVQRFLDFSTQWFITKEKKITYLGATIMHNTSCGKYEKTIAGDEEALFGPYISFLKEHLEKVKNPLMNIASEGFFGHIGIDAMVYRHPTEMDELLHPIVEINPRKTMGWLTLRLKKKWNAPFLSLSYHSKAEEGLLPQEIVLPNKEKISFRKQLKADIVSTWKHSELQAENL